MPNSSTEESARLSQMCISENVKGGAEPANFSGGTPRKFARAAHATGNWIEKPFDKLTRCVGWNGFLA